MNENLFQKNIKFLEESNPEFLKTKEIDLEKAKKKARKAKESPEHEYWLKLEKKAVHLPCQIPRNDESFEFIKKEVKKHKIENSIEPIINRQIDLTLWRFLIEIIELIEQTDIDPNKTITTMGSGGIGLIGFGTGSGECLLSLIKGFQPYKIALLVSDWHDYVSSFWEIDWDDLYQECSKMGTDLSVTRVENEWNLLATLCSKGLLWLDHAYIFESPSTDEKLLKWSDILHRHECSNLVHYLGYTVDEFNMMIQSTQTLLRQPKLFTKPSEKLGCDFIICGSGPSLDKNINRLKELQKNHIIVCGGSSYKALKDNGIRVDYLTLMERDYDIGNDDYAGYNKELSGSKSDTRLVMADVCWHEMLDTFNESCVFFRSALTPLSIYSTNPGEVLGFEGPEAVNAAVSFCATLGAAKIVLFGVDLGSKYQDETRSKIVLGTSNRIFDQEGEGNLCDKVMTCSSMINVQQVLEALVKGKKKEDEGLKDTFKTRFINCSDGLKIAGFEQVDPEKYEASTIDNNTKGCLEIDEWWESLQTYSHYKIRSQWKYRNARGQTFKLCRELENLYQGETSFYPDVLKETERLMDIEGSLEVQFPRRMMRGTILKSVLAVSQQLQILRGNKSKYVAWFGGKARERLCSLTRTLEEEIYLLLDYIENTLFE
ncbi:6-hydroxymethylpterin diphosphokinase MptE-like protein [Prochlorococcus sp. MIT 1306]|uniref:6-hydroxymethylpterin diphosphokinase MptE-like protein n=1 Tax=Prochlorococcus sp. MIT 1306 TaxID=1799667 RepID=UPI0007B383AF|nr:6-hydroxymethylpterin diphosphokinase MptE-like protein [Prochlorococcus sp. MIT 1306]KZR61067.1 hypothetical protein PMIT1306_01846 [Prochlorococcus sp. MIT 1306]